MPDRIRPAAQRGLAASQLLLFLVVGALGIGVGIGVSQLKTDDNDLRPTAEPNRPPSISAEEQRAIDAALEQASDQDYGPLDGVISGTVVDPSGAGVSGVVFTARPVLAPSESDDPIEIAEHALANFHSLRALTSTGTSDESGAFRIEGIGQGNYLVGGEAPLAAIAPEGDDTAGENRQVTAAAGTEIAFIADPAGAVVVAIRGPQGSEPDSASIQILQTADGMTRTSTRRWSPTSRRVLFTAEASLELVAIDEDRVSAPTPVSIRLGEEQELTLELADRIGIRGHIYSHTGRLATDAIFRFGPAKGPMPSLQQAAEQLPRAPRQLDGRYQAMDLQPGEYWIAAGRSWDSVEVIEAITIDRLLDHDLTLPEPDLSKSVVIFAFAPDGSAIGELRCSVSIEHSRGSSSYSTSTTRQPDGGHVLDLASRLDREGSGSDVTIRLTVTSDQYGSEMVELTPDSLGEVRIEFSEPGFVDLNVTDLPPHVAGLALASLSTQGEEGWNSRSYEVPVDGKVRIGPAKPGECEVRILLRQSRGSGMWNQVLAAAVPIQLSSGVQELSVPCPRVHAVTFRFPESAGSGSMNLQRVDLDNSNMHFEIPASGDLSLACLPAGRYQLQIYGREMQTMTVDVVADGVIDFQAQVVDALEITITDPASPLHDLGFQDGDLIIAIEGQTFEGARAIQMALMATMSRPEVAVTVLRGAREMELKFEPQVLMRSQGGARVRPVSRGQ